MDRKLLLFIKALRHAEIPVSAADSLLALETVALLGYEDREQLKRALSIVLAKSAADKQRFFICFERFFQSANSANDTADRSQEESEAADHKALNTFAHDTLENIPTIDAATERFSIDADQLSPLSDLLLSNNQQEVQLQIPLAAANVKLENMVSFTQKGQYQRRILVNMGLENLQTDIRELSLSDNSADNHHAHQLREALLGLREQINDYVEQQYQLHAAWRGEALQKAQLEKINLSHIERSQYTMLQSMIRELARKLKKRYSRRQRVQQRGRLDLHRTLRHNVAYDGNLLELHWRFKHRKAPQVYAFCDVSNSVSRYARFFLLFLHSLQELLPQIRSFVFTNQLVEVSELFEQLPPADAIDKTLDRWGGLSSDYGRSLTDLEWRLLPEIKRNSWVIILGDARNNYSNLRLDVLQKLHARCAQVVWLNPEAKSLWNTGDSEMARYASACHQVHGCHNLRELDAALQEMLKRR